MYGWNRLAKIGTSMKGSLFFYLPFLVQALVIAYDEFYFHLKRGLPLWERIGHPLDTLSLIVCIAFVLVFSYSKALSVPFIAMGALSCLLVTKDEFVHKEHCNAKEQWLHALLFLNHPLVLISMGWMWSQGKAYTIFLTWQLVFVSLFCLYQVIYWNLVWKEK
jgi:hypothetical protein